MVPDFYAALRFCGFRGQSIPALYGPRRHEGCVQVLSKFRHPHLVILMGWAPSLGAFKDLRDGHEKPGEGLLYVVSRKCYRDEGSGMNADTSC